MSSIPGMSLDDIRMDATNLYREEVITDLRVGSLHRLVPIKTDGTDDPSRPVHYTAQAQIMSQAGPLPIEAPIDAASLAEALEKFPLAVKAAVAALIQAVVLTTTARLSVVLLVVLWKFLRVVLGKLRTVFAGAQARPV